MEHINFFCINLDIRTDRWINCQKQFIQQWIEKVERWSAKPLPENRRFWAWLSHREIIEYAKSKNWEYVWVFEDDINFVNKKFLIKATRALGELKKKEWYMLYFWGSLGRNAKLVKENWTSEVLRVEKNFEAHAVIYHKRFFDIYLQKHPSEYSVGIGEYYLDNKYRAFDEWYADVVQKDYPCYITNKILVTQRNDFSNIENKFVSRYKKSIYRFWLYKYLWTKIGTYLDKSGAQIKNYFKNGKNN